MVPCECRWVTRVCASGFVWVGEHCRKWSHERMCLYGVLLRECQIQGSRNESGPHRNLLFNKWIHTNHELVALLLNA
jgi:hypothetical protein